MKYKKNIKLLIEYEGTNYSGWQTQLGVRTIQETIEGAIKKQIGERVNLIGSGRTDKGVHARGQVANFRTNSLIPGERYKLLLKYHLPYDITIMDSEEVHMNFHSRYDATRKIYKYIVFNGDLASALYRNFSYYVPYKLDMDRMIKASKYLLGDQDFASFMVAGTKVHTTIRTIYNIEIFRSGDFIEFHIDGNSFLRNMVRIIVGTLINIGRGKIDLDQMSSIILAKNRKEAGPTAPPQGLFLEKVFYEEKGVDIDNYMY